MPSEGPEHDEKVRQVTDSILFGSPDDIRTVLSAILAIGAVSKKIDQHLSPSIDAVEGDDEARVAFLTELARGLDGMDMVFFMDHVRAVLGSMIDIAAAWGVEP